MNKILLILLIAFSFSCQAQFFPLNRNYAASEVCVDLSVYSYTYTEKETTSPETAPTGFHWLDDGNTYYVIGVALDSVTQWDLSTAWDIATGTNVGSVIVNEGGTLPIGMTMTTDKSIMYVCNYTDDKIHQYDLSTPGLITSATHTSSSPVVSPVNPSDIEISEDGAIMWIMAGNNIKEYSLTPGDITTLSDNSVTLSCGTEESACQGFSFCPTRDALYVIGTANDTAYEYRMTSADDISTATYSGRSFDTAQVGAGSNPQDLYFKPEGDILYVVDTGNDSVEFYDVD